jgi:hypothetical protein
VTTGWDVVNATFLAMAPTRWMRRTIRAGKSNGILCASRQTMEMHCAASEIEV